MQGAELLNENSNLPIDSEKEINDLTNDNTVIENDQTLNGKVESFKSETFDYQIIKSAENSISAELELYLKDLRDENEKLKVTLENNNIVMKNQLKNLQDWQLQMTANQQKQVEKEHEYKSKIEKLTTENSDLKERVNQLEGMADLKLVEELGVEVAELRSQVAEIEQYKKLNYHLTSKLEEVKNELEILTKEKQLLDVQMQGANEELSCYPALKEQLSIYEKDFKVEELAKIAAIREIQKLEAELEKVKFEKEEIEAKLERGQLHAELKDDESSVGRRSHRHHRRGKQ